jgi:hypothetical protein
MLGHAFYVREQVEDFDRLSLGRVYPLFDKDGKPLYYYFTKANSQTVMR